MDGFGGGTGVMLAVAAVLWLLYLVPEWFKRREYLATERNTLRLQQSLRVLAETAEVPEVVRVEATARSAAEQERILAERRRAADEQSRREAERVARERAELRAAERAREAAARREVARSRRLNPARRAHRRGRTVAALTLLAALTAVAGQGIAITAGALAPAAWAGVGAAGLVALLAVGMLRALARRGRSAVAAPVPARRVTQPLTDFAPVREQPREWTPVPLPKPLYMSKPLVEAPVMADPREHERRVAGEQSGAVARIGAAASRARTVGASSQAAPPSRFAEMGRVDLGAGAVPDVDAALRRRRAAG